MKTKGMSRVFFEEEPQQKQVANINKY